MYDRNILRKRYSKKYLAGIRKYRAGFQGTSQRKHPSWAVYARKRPIFKDEVKSGDFDAISVSGTQLVTHNCNTKADLVTPTLEHEVHSLHGVFPSNSAGEQVYLKTGLHKAVLAFGSENKPFNLILVGQTGSGKTHTMSELMNIMSRTLFIHKKKLKMEAFEIQGTRIFDLFNNHKELSLNISPDATVFQVQGTRKSRITKDNMHPVFLQAMARRKTQSTMANDTSSRSHAVFRISSKKAVLLMVDLAGTERRKDSDQHTQQLVRESVLINESWFGLKQCLRKRALSSKQGGSQDFRASTLTKVLSPALVNKSTPLICIGCVSPAATDMEHTRSTLDLLSDVAPQLPTPRASTAVLR